MLLFFLNIKYGQEPITYESILFKKKKKKNNNNNTRKRINGYMGQKWMRACGKNGTKNVQNAPQIKLKGGGEPLHN